MYDISEKMNKKDLSREIRKIVIPIALQNLLVTIVNASDAIMLGSLNEASLSAANLAGQLMQVYNFFLISLCIGTTVLAAQYWGKEDTVSVKKVLHITLQISITGGVIFFLLCVFIPQIVMSFFTSDYELITLGSEYLRYVSASYLFMGFSQVYMIIMKNTGRVAQSATYGAIAVFVNIILNTILIFGIFGFPKLGIIGAAIATSIARFVEFVLTVISSSKYKSTGFSIKELFKRHKSLERKYVRYTLPGVVQTMSWRIGTTVNIAILGHMSSEIISANAVANIVFDIMSAIAMAYASGCGTIVGQALGNGELDNAKQYGDFMVKKSLIIGTVIGILTFLISPLILVLAGTLSVKSKYYLQLMLLIISIKMIGKFNNATLSKGIFVAGGDLKYHMKIDIINMWCVIVPLSLISAFVFKIPVIFVYLIMNMDEYTKMYYEISRYRKYIWIKNLTKKEWAEPGKYDLLLKEKIINNMPMGVLVVGSSGKISIVNERAKEILGFDSDDMVGVNYISAFIEDKRNDELAQILIDSMDDKSKKQEKVVNYYKNNVCKKLQITTSFVEEEDTNIGILAMINDLTVFINK